MVERAGSPGRSCGVCRGRLIRWGSYRRGVRAGPERSLVRVARLRCQGCRRTSGVLPDGILHRRLDPIEVVGPVVAAGMRGTTTIEIAALTGVPARTVRDIRARYRSHAPDLAMRLFTATFALGGWLSLAIDIPVDPQRRAAFALGAAWTAARRRGETEPSPWRWLAVTSGGRVLPTNTRLPRTARRGPVVLNPGPATGPTAAPRRGPARPMRPPGRAPPSSSEPDLSSGEARLHRPPPDHLHPVRPDHHHTARPPTTSTSSWA